MHENWFKKARLDYKPPLPLVLQGIKTVVLEQKESSSNHASVATYFPHSHGRPTIYFHPSFNQKPLQPLTVGVIFSGGQASGGHNVVSGLWDALQTLHPSSKLIGFKEGPDGLIQDKFEELTAERIAAYRNCGGFDLLGSGRTKIETTLQLEAVSKTVVSHKLNGLVIVGGDDSSTNAAFITEYFLAHNIKTCVVTVPKTIDGDLKGHSIEVSFGFDTATKVYSELIGNLQQDALSAKKYYHFVKLMGRSASHITLECALQTRPNVALIAEEVLQKKITLSQLTHHLADLISQRANLGKNYGVILVPEGLIEFIPEVRTVITEMNRQALSAQSQNILKSLPQIIQNQLQEDRDPHGNVQLSKIETEVLLIKLVQQELAQRSSFKGKFNPVSHFFGYEGRAAYPTDFDAAYCQALGYASAVLIQQNCTGYMACISNLGQAIANWQVKGVALTSMMSLEERKGHLKPVIAKSLVNLDAEPFRYFASQRDRLAVRDQYTSPGPTQYFIPNTVATNLLPLTLQIEQHLLASV